MSDISPIDFGEMRADIRHLAKSFDGFAATFNGSIQTLVSAIKELGSRMPDRATERLERCEAELAAIKQTYRSFKVLVYGILLGAMVVSYGLWDALSKLRALPPLP